MSCIVGIKYKNRVYMGADSCVTETDRSLIIKDPKIFKRGDFLIGFCGDLRPCQILKQAKFSNEIDSISKLVEFIKDLFKKEGYIRRGKEHDEPIVFIDSEFMVAHKGRLYVISDDLSIVEDAKNNYTAIGSGANYALGVLYSNRNSKMSTRKRLIESLGASAYFDPKVSGPFKIFSVEK